MAGGAVLAITWRVTILKPVGAVNSAVNPAPALQVASQQAEIAHLQSLVLQLQEQVAGLTQTSTVATNTSFLGQEQTTSAVAELQKLPQLLAVMTAMGCPNARVSALIEKLAVKTKARAETEDKENMENGNPNKGGLLTPAVPPAEPPTASRIRERR